MPKTPPSASPPKEPHQHIMDQMQAVRPLVELMGLFSPDLRVRFAEVERASKVVETMMAEQERFATIYSPRGWTIYDRISTDVVAEVLPLDVVEGDKRLTQHHLAPDTLERLGWLFQARDYEPWSAIFDRAVERVAAEDFLSAVPLVLLIIDGICTSTTQKHPFSGGADAPVFDTLTARRGGLADGLKVLGATRRKLSLEPISAPYRHGILHGLDPDYGHPIVAAKAFNLLQAMVDYFSRRRDEEERIARAVKDQSPVDFGELAAKVETTQRHRKAIDTWVARPTLVGENPAKSGEPSLFESGTPEEAAAGYLNAIIARNFGQLAKLTVDYPKRALGYRAGRIRKELEGVEISAWRITGISDDTAAFSFVETRLEGLVRKVSWSKDLRMRLAYMDVENLPVVRGEPEGHWLIQPDYLTFLWQARIAHDNPE